jgi:hypothetical protein
MPSDDMFFDDAHLNTKKGIPSIVKFLKKSSKHTEHSNEKTIVIRLVNAKIKIGTTT